MTATTTEIVDVLGARVLAKRRLQKSKEERERPGVQESLPVVTEPDTQIQLMQSS